MSLRSRAPSRARFRATAAAVAAGLLLPLAAYSTAEAARPARADRASDWETTQLTRDRVRNVQFGVTDWGLTLDTYFALVAAGNHPRQARAVIGAVSRNVRVYVSFDGDFFAGAVAKTLLARRVAGLDPNIGRARLDLRNRLVSLVAPAGRVRDSGQSDVSNTLSQSLSVLALARSGRLRPRVVDYLVRQQCDPGFFRLQMRAADCRVGGAADVDATAFALQALVRARQEGVDLPSGAVADTARWLVGAQRRNGSFSGQGLTRGANSNSTGLAAQALELVGRDAASQRAGRFVAGLQLTRAKGGDTPARRDLGAIAYNRGDLRLALDQGISRSKRDVWRRSTPQALFALVPAPLTTLRAP